MSKPFSILRKSKNKNRRQEMKSKLSTLGCVLMLSAMIISGCGTTTAEPTTGLANPASVYCEEQGYTLEMRTDADGGQYGVCIFPDGSECEEWAFYRGECGPAASDAEQPIEASTVAPTEVPTVQPTETPTPAEPAETWVYVDLMPDESGTTLTWMDSLSGAANSVPAPGTGYQVIGEWVYYQEGNGTVHRVNEAGQDERFDFMDIPEDNFETVEWAISPDGTQIVWNRFSFEAEQSGGVTLTSDLYIAAIATGETRLLITYVIHEHQKLTPWGFSPDGSQVFVYLQPYGIGGLFAAYGAFSALDVATGKLTPLHDPAPDSFPGPAAALSDDGTRLARFLYTEDQGFKINLTDLASGQTTEIATLPSELEYVQVGDAVFSPDGSTLIYTVAYGDWGSEGFALFQIDSSTGTQREILAPQPTHYKVAHFEDDGLLLLTIAWPGEGTGTFRLHPDGTLEHLSEATFVGISQ
jgi:putative hemolysin